MLVSCGWRPPRRMLWITSSVFNPRNVFQIRKMKLSSNPRDRFSICSLDIVLGLIELALGSKSGDVEATVDGVSVVNPESIRRLLLELEAKGDWSGRFTWAIEANFGDVVLASSFWPPLDCSIPAWTTGWTFIMWAMSCLAVHWNNLQQSGQNRSSTFFGSLISRWKKMLKLSNRPKFFWPIPLLIILCKLNIKI